MTAAHSHLHPAAVRSARSLLLGTRLQSETVHLLTQALPIVRLEPMTAQPAPGRSRFGGQGVLPADLEEWPTWDPSPMFLREAEAQEKHIARAISGASPRPYELVLRWQSRAEAIRHQAQGGARGLSLLAMIDLAEVPGAELLGLPGGGILWFFADPEVFVTERDSWRVMWSDEGEHLAIRSAPANTHVFPETPIAMVPAVFLPDHASLRDGTAVADLERDFSNEESASKSASQLSPGDLMDRLNRGPTPWPQSLGHAVGREAYCRSRMYSAFEDSRTPPGQRGGARDWKAIERQAAAWRCILNLSWAEPLFGEKWTWGDPFKPSELQFWISSEDLAARRFGQTQIYRHV